MQGFWQFAADQHTVLFARTFLALVLLTASVAKLGNLREFVRVVRNYRLLPEVMVPFVGRALPAIETIVGVGLLFGILTSWLASAAASLFLLFGSAVAINLLRGRREISCGCFGPQQNHHLTWSLVLRNSGLAGLAAIIWLVSPSLDRSPQLPIPETVATILLAGGALASWSLCGVILKMWRTNDTNLFSPTGPRETP